PDQTAVTPRLMFSTGVVNPGTLTHPLCTLSSTQTAQNCTPQANLFPSPFPPPKNSAFALGGLYFSWDPANNYQVPTVYNWNLAIERQLPSTILVRAAYVGSRSTHLTETLNLAPSPSSTTGTYGTIRLNDIPSSLGSAPRNSLS